MISRSLVKPLKFLAWIFATLLVLFAALMYLTSGSQVGRLMGDFPPYYGGDK
jgi:hypothetical protein